MATPLISVVTPVHNGQEHLAECVESIKQQTFDNWEYVIVDNCSTDRTPGIAQSFARSDPRIRYKRYEEFVDAVRNHNRAAQAVGPKSSYCKVVGADDWLYPQCLERMVEIAETNPRVGIVGAYRLNDTRVDLTGLPYVQTVLPGREILTRSLLWKLSVIGSPTATLLRSDLVRDRKPFYDPTFRHADIEAAYWALTRSDFGVVHQVLTFTRKSPESETAVSDHLNSHPVDHLRLLLRYGPTTLQESEYQRCLRLRLRRHVRWLLKQRLKASIEPARQHDKEFWAYQRKAMELILAEAPRDPDVQRGMAAYRRLLPKPPAPSSTFSISSFRT